MLYMYVVGELVLLVLAYFCRDWHSINTFIAILSILIMICTILVIPESPRYLISSKYYEECYNVLVKMARMNEKSHKMFSKESFFKQIESNKDGTIANHQRELEKRYQETLQSTNFNEIQSLLNIKVKSSGNQESDIELLEKNSGSIIFFLFNPIKNLFMTLAMSYIWIALSMIYFGVSLGKYKLDQTFTPEKTQVSVT